MMLVWLICLENRVDPVALELQLNAHLLKHLRDLIRKAWQSQARLAEAYVSRLDSSSSGRNGLL